MNSILRLLLVVFTCLLLPTVGQSHEGPYAEWIRRTARSFYAILAEYDENKNGCVDNPADFQDLLETFITTRTGSKPRFTQLCFKRLAEDEYQVHWELSPTPRRARAERRGQRINTPDIWIVSLNTEEIKANGKPVPNFSMEREGGFHLRVRGTHSEVTIRGIGFNLTKEIVKKNIPESLLHFGMKKFEINDNGHFEAKVSAPLFGIPVKARGDYRQKKLDGLELEIFGFKFPVTR